MLVTSGAGFQLLSPACEATMVTSPAPVKVRVVPPLMLPGPRRTAKLTGRPLEAVAERFTVAVVAWSEIWGKSIVWSCGGAPTLP